MKNKIKQYIKECCRCVQHLANSLIQVWVGTKPADLLCHLISPLSSSLSSLLNSPSLPSLSLLYSTLSIPKCPMLTMFSKSLCVNIRRQNTLFISEQSVRKNSHICNRRHGSATFNKPDMACNGRGRRRSETLAFHAGHHVASQHVQSHISGFVRSNPNHKPNMNQGGINELPKE